MPIKDFELIYQENRVEIKNKEEIKQQLIDILGPENISTREVDILAYTKDTMLITLNWSIEGKIAGLPDIITFPETVEQISEILKIANREKIPVTPYAEGSGVVGGAIPVYGGIIIDMKKFKRIIELNDKNLTVTVETGINGMNLERYLNANGYTSGHIPQSIYTSSVGGYIAHRAAGQFSTKYGKIEDMVLGMEVVLPKGKIINFKTIARASTGPQLDKLFIGGEGTLGIVTKVTLKIWPYPEKRCLISYSFPSLEDSLEATRNILRKNISPAVIRIYDDKETERHFGKVKEKVMVIFVCEGEPSLVDLEEKITREQCVKYNGKNEGEEPVEHWFETRFNVKETSMFPPYRIVADTIEIACMWDIAPELYHKVIESTSSIKGNLLISAHISHFYPNGIGYYFTFGGVPMGDQTEYDFYKECWNSTVKAVEDLGASFGHHHGVGINRSQWMGEEWGKAFETLKEIKKLLDPNNILNPGKIYESIWIEQKGEK
ncbi:MAG: FAD-binding protein [Candidatus Lokiarchaeota archaeon]|nr:FAD-binding protein [Candidatus Lokiarchaeota archaeon]